MVETGHISHYGFLIWASSVHNVYKSGGDHGYEDAHIQARHRTSDYTITTRRTQTHLTSCCSCQQPDMQTTNTTTHTHVDTHSSGTVNTQLGFLSVEFEAKRKSGLLWQEWILWRKRGCSTWSHIQMNTGGGATAILKMPRVSCHREPEHALEIGHIYMHTTRRQTPCRSAWSYSHMYVLQRRTPRKSHVNS